MADIGCLSCYIVYRRRKRLSIGIINKNFHAKLYIGLYIFILYNIGKDNGETIYGSIWLGEDSGDEGNRKYE